VTNGFISILPSFVKRYPEMALLLHKQASSLPLRLRDALKTDLSTDILARPQVYFGSTSALIIFIESSIEASGKNILLDKGF
jgi:hypothetical protein